MEDNKRIAGNLHLFICTKHHVPKDGVSSDTDCCWYLEEQISTRWEEPDHLEYIVYANAFIEVMGVEDLDKALNTFRDACSKVSFASNAYPAAVDVLRKMIVKAI